MSHAPALRERLVDQLLADGGLTRPDLARAFATVPRELFLAGGFHAGERFLRPGDDGFLDGAYRNDALVTKLDDGVPVSSSSQPSLMALMIEALGVTAGMRVLEIGAGTGYNAALMAAIGAEVTSVDVQPDVAARAAAALSAAGVVSARVHLGDGYLGHPPGAPYDRVIVTVGVTGVSPHWLDQLSPGGVVLAPVAHAGTNPVLRIRATAAPDPHAARGRHAALATDTPAGPRPPGGRQAAPDRYGDPGSRVADGHHLAADGPQVPYGPGPAGDGRGAADGPGAGGGPDGAIDPDTAVTRQRTAGTGAWTTPPRPAGPQGPAGSFTAAPDGPAWPPDRDVVADGVCGAGFMSAAGPLTARHPWSHPAPIRPAGDLPTTVRLPARWAEPIDGYRYHDLWFAVGAWDRRATSAPFDGTSGCVLADETGTGGAAIRADGSVDAAGTHAEEYARDARVLVERWDDLGQPGIPRWRAGMVLAGDPAAPIYVPRGWCLVA